VYAECQEFCTAKIVEEYEVVRLFEFCLSYGFIVMLFWHSNICTCTQLDGLEKSFYSFYICTAVRKFFFFLDPLRTGRVRIQDILACSFLDDLLEVYCVLLILLPVQVVLLKFDAYFCKLLNLFPSLL